MRRHSMLPLLVAALAAAGCASPSEAPSPVPEAQPSARAAGSAQAGPPLTPVTATPAVPHDADDPAIWVSPDDPPRSFIVATDKVAKSGGLYVFGLDGALRQTVTPLDRPNNVDVEYGFSLGGRAVDIAVVTERMSHRLRIYCIRPDGSGLDEVSAGGGAPVLSHQTGEAAEPMGIALYRRPRDGAVFAIVAPKTGGTAEYLWQYLLEDDGKGRVTATFVRRFGAFSQQGAEPGETGEIEAVTVDDELGFVYYADERFGIRKWAADPDSPDAGRELAVFGRDGYLGDREGLAVFRTAPGRGFIVSSDQVAGGSRVKLFTREGGPLGPHDHVEVATVPTSADETDGLDVTAASLPDFPGGLLVMMNSSSKNFLLFAWEAVDRAHAAGGR